MKKARFLPVWLVTLCLASVALSQAAEARKHQTLQPTALGTPASPLAKAAAPKLPPYVPGEVIVRFKEGVSESAQAAVHARLKAKVVRHLLLSRTVLVKLEDKRNEKAAAAAYERQGGVSLAQPNFIRHPDAIHPNDPSFSELWGLNNTGQSVSGIPGGTADADIDAPEAWQQITGSSAVTVAVVDTGVDVAHPDLAGRTVAGYDFVDNDPTPQDTVGHGTAMAGIIAAAGNDGAGITGVNWDVRMMPLRVCASLQGCTDQRIADAFAYAGTNGVKVVNASLGGPNAAPVVSAAITGAPNTLFVVSAGNGGDDGQGDNNDNTHEYPCDFTHANIVCVTATNQSDQLTGFANYSATSVDLAAPGLDTLSDWPGSQFTYLNGTSASAAYGSGAAALVLASSPTASVATVKSRLLGNVDPKSALSGKTVTGGRLNVAAALVPPAAPQAPGSLDSTFNGGNVVTTDFAGGGEFAYDVAVQNDGKIVAAGRRTSSGGGSGPSDFAIARYNADGTLDTTFDGDGMVTTDMGSAVDTALAVAIEQSSGKIVVGGGVQPSGTQFWAIARYNPNGTLDTSFDSDGKLVTALVGDIYDVVVQSDGKIVATGRAPTGGLFGGDFRVARFNTTGSLDSGFGSGGSVLTDLAGPDLATDLEIQSDGKIVVAGTARSQLPGSDLAFVRYNANGTLDTSFDGDGKQMTDFVGTDEGNAVALQSDGKIIAAGFSQPITNGKIAFSTDRDGNNEIYTMNGDGTGVTRLTNNSASDSWPFFSPDGTKIAFVSDRDGNSEIYSMNADGTAQTRLTNDAAADYDPSWSPDDNFIAFASERSGNGGFPDIWRMNSDGSGTPTRLTNNSGQVDWSPVWSPDGTKIAFGTDRDGNFEVYTMNPLDGSSQTNITNNSAIDAEFSWSPDGTKIGFSSARDGDFEIFTMNPDGSSVTQLTSNSSLDQRPVFSPDGTKIAFTTFRDGNNEVYSMNANGTGQTNLTNNAALDSVRSWQSQIGTSNFALSRYSSSGSLDSTFDGDGKVTTGFGGLAEAEDVLVQNNPGLSAYKKILAIGQTRTPPYQFALTRYNENGSLDPSFDGDGKVVTGGGNNQVLNAATIQSDGNIVVAGERETSFVHDFALARYSGGRLGVFPTPDSELDPAGHSLNMIISGFEPNDTVQIQQCREGAPSGNVCVGVQNVTLNSSGGFGTAINVNYTVQGFAASCEDPYCAVRVSSTTGLGSKSTPISFKQPSTLTATPSAGQITANQAITLGQSVTDTAVVQGNAKGGTPTGSVSFFWCGPVDLETCRTGTQIGLAVGLTPGANNSANATSASFTPGATGRYCLRAVYSGTNRYRSSSDAGFANCIYVRPTPDTFAAVNDPYISFKNFNFTQQAASGLLLNDIHPGAISVVPFSGPTAQGGTVTVASDGSFTYVPATNFTGPDSFTYTATDGGVETSQGTALMTVTDLDPLEYTKYRYTKYRYTKYRDIAQAQLTVYAFCGPRLVSVNPQVTLFEPTLVQLSASLYDAAGNRLLATPGYLANGEFGGDPFQPNILAWPDWTTPAPAGGAYVEVLLEADFDTAAPYTERVTVPCAT